MSDIIRIRGGKPLAGEVTASGSKNGSLPILAAALLMQGESRLRNIPQIEDVETMLALLRACGAEVTRTAPDEVSIVPGELRNSSVSEALAGKMRASYYVMAPLVVRLGQASLPFPGGCNLGRRPVGYIVDALVPLGMESEIEEKHFALKCDEIHGGKVVLDPRYRSPGATFMAVMAASMAQGITTIENACGEPDVVNFCEFLARGGAAIEGAGTGTITVRGVRELRGVEHGVLGDRLEAGTYLLAGAASRGEVAVKGIRRDDLAGFVEALEKSGAKVTDESETVRVAGKRRPRAQDIVTAPYPGFPTDLQPPMSAYLAIARGTSTIEESIFTGRMGHVEELRRLGAKIETEERKATIHGVAKLEGAQVEALNIRAGAALIVAAAGATGETVIHGRSHIARGYAQIEEKLRALGAEVGTE